MRRWCWLCVIFVMILVWPQHRYLSTTIWRVHKDMNKFHKRDRVPLFRFNSTIIQWENMRKDNIAFRLTPVFDTALGKFELHNLNMHVYETPERSSLSEIYSLHMDQNQADSATLDFSFESRDVHLSPFRRLYIDAGVDWTIGRAPTTYCPYVRRRGAFIKQDYHESHHTFLTPDQWYVVPVVLTCLLAFADIYYQTCHHRRKTRFPDPYTPLLHPM